MNRFNEIMRDLVLGIFNDCCILGVVSCVYLLVRFHEQLNYSAIVTAWLAVLTTVALLVVTYTKFGYIQQLSENFVSASGKRLVTASASTDGNNKDELLLQRKYIKSCRPIRVEGTFSVYNKLDGIKVVSKLIVYSSKFLIMTKTFG